ncbi:MULTISPECIES: ABC transporter ATP-binding protein [Collinsella]|uniref:ABC transporter ATP-binding protein n=1 Tax=Collinsella TaxID=102106 RepID=UPI000B38D3CD|nr:MULTISPECIES: ABC transporter ATP-binding protein [Collinsella]MBM6683226.1 ABC transporter ATP-binding protein [Collinsella intestinalis]OUN47792.1 peptide ABC transporter ATP-binding protein [Collinsella sp. An7]
MALLEVRDLVTEFPTRKGVVRAVNGVTFDVESGEILAVVGESGSGKSVTSLSIMRLLQDPGHVASGSITFDGEDLLAASEAEMERVRGGQISMIFQEPMTSLNPVYRVGDQIVEAIRTHSDMSKKDAWARAVEMLRVVGIPSPEERARDYPHQMSGGMRQRVMIAMALSCDPKLLIADEPTTALDVTIQAQILDLIYKLRSEFNMAVLLITHDLGVVSEVADRVVVMYCGQVVEEGEKFELFEHPLHPYTLGLLKSIPRLEDEESERLYMIRGSVPNPLEMPPGCPFSDRCDRCFERCRTEVPELTTVPGTTRRVRCFLYDDAAEVERAVVATEAAHQVKAKLEAEERERIEAAAAAAAAASVRRPQELEEVPADGDR